MISVNLILLDRYPIVNKKIGYFIFGHVNQKIKLVYKGGDKVYNLSVNRTKKQVNQNYSRSIS